MHSLTSQSVCSVSKDVSLEVELTIEDLAECIIHLSSEEQAMLISRMAELATFSVPMQLQYLTDEECLTPEGRNLMEQIGAYAWS